MSRRIVVLGATGTWHAQHLLEAFAARGHSVHAVPATQLVSSVSVDGAVRVEGPEGVRLDESDLVVVRGLPRGSLEQVIYRMDVLHGLAAAGVPVVNHPRGLERTVDKAWATTTLAAAGVPVPPTVVCERRGEALDAFAALGGDVVVKPLFGAMGSGIVRIEDPDVAFRVFGALELERAVYYLQATIAPSGRRDLRVLVAGGEVLGAMERVSEGWRANVARGGRPRAVSLRDEERSLALRAAAALEVEIAGVDMLSGADGSLVVPEVNGIPGWQALQGVCGVDLTAAVVDRCLAVGGGG